ncbi:MAG: hypothetical protein F4147_00945 [Gammaproteobacteria bacterium]|nr:hypothetical protein [Gammaproteobacteria bacterium]
MKPERQESNAGARGKQRAQMPESAPLAPQPGQTPARRNGNPAKQSRQNRSAGDSAGAPQRIHRFLINMRSSSQPVRAAGVDKTGSGDNIFIHVDR